MKRYMRRLERDIIRGQVSQAILLLAKAQRGEYVYLSTWKVRRILAMRFYSRQEAAEKTQQIRHAIAQILDGTGVPYMVLRRRRGKIYMVRRADLITKLDKNNLILIEGETPNA